MLSIEKMPKLKTSKLAFRIIPVGGRDGEDGAGMHWDDSNINRL